MSRIDEALKRAAGAHAGRSASRAAEPSRKLAHHFTLDQYPIEISAQERLVARVAINPPLSTIPNVSTGQEPQLFKEMSVASNAKLVVGSEADPVSVEQYRRLAATLHEAQVEKALKIVMVTSATP